MPLRSEYYALLADPSPLSWRAIVALLDEQGDTDAQHLADVAALAGELKAWPPEVQRPAPKHWLTDNAHIAEVKLCRDVREVQLYAYFIDAAASTPLLRLRDGTPAVRLQRNFTGMLQGAAGRTHRIGVEGQGDLCGSLCVEWEYIDEEYERVLLGYHPDNKPLRRLPVSLEVEIKRDGKKMRPAQEQRRDALRRRGEISLTVYRTEELIRLLIVERDRILKEITGC